MAQIETGLRSVLSSPQVYNMMQNLMGAQSTRREYIQRYMPFESDDKILDIGCGTAEIVSLLPAGVDYHGYDMSSRYVEFAVNKFLGRGVFKVALVNSVEIEQLPKMNWVLAMGLLHHLDDLEASTLMELAQSVLAGGGRFVAIDPCITTPQNPIARWLIEKDRGQNVRTSEQYFQLAKKVFERVDVHVSHRSWIPYTHNIIVAQNENSI